jgi:hypothetical protein
LFENLSSNPTSRKAKMMIELSQHLSEDVVQLGKLLDEYVQSRGVCSMTGSIYDTAWVSMVSKSVEGEKTWLFPKSFKCVYEKQAVSGGWEGGESTDEIVNSLACLLALKKHQNVGDGPENLADRIKKAVEFLTEKLSDWNNSPDRVAFDILIPSMLDLLEAEGVPIRFPDSEKLRLMNLQERKAVTNSAVFYKYPSTILHSLESFTGAIDFDKMTPHLRDGSMMGSPSSTAAYLINASVWDDSAERYLCDALENGKRIEDGMVTNVFPVSTFEFAWVSCYYSLLTSDHMQYFGKWNGIGCHSQGTDRAHPCRLFGRRLWRHGLWYILSLKQTDHRPIRVP